MRHTILGLLLIAPTLFSAPSCSSAQTSTALLENQADNIVNIRDNDPGAVVMVLQNNQLVFTKSYGVADLDKQIPFKIETRSNLGSISKQFTAYGILLLASRGDLALDNDIRKHIPELPDFGPKVTLKHLLTHTSGYREIYHTLALAGHRLFQDDVDRQEMVAVVQRQPSLQHPPGARWQYNNTGYGLLALVIERVTGTDFPKWMDGNVFKPLGMDQTVVRGQADAIPPNSAHGYSQTPLGYQETRNLGGAVGASAIYTTAHDMATWMRHFKTDTGDLFSQMIHPYTLTNGQSTGYGLGLYIDHWRGQTRVHHGGDDAAHRAAMIYFPDFDGTVVILSNNAAFNQYRAADKLTLAFFPNHFEAHHNPMPLPPAFDADDLDRYAGRYEMESTPGLVFTFKRNGDYLVGTAAGDRFTLTPLSDSLFQVLGQDAHVRFHQQDGSISSATIIQQDEQRLRRLSPGEKIILQPVDLSAYTGRYDCKELNTYYDLTLESQTLALVHHLFEKPVRLRPVQTDRFAGTAPVSSVRFKRDTQGQVTGFYVGNGSDREYIWFEKHD